MSNQRKRLVEQLKEIVKFFSNRRTVGRMKTEHSIFIPSSMLLEQAEETEEFIKAARYINSKPEWGCKVTPEKQEGKLSGVEFVFEFSTDTDFDSIISELARR